MTGNANGAYKSRFLNALRENHPCVIQKSLLETSVTQTQARQSSAQTPQYPFSLVPRSHDQDPRTLSSRPQGGSPLGYGYHLEARLSCLCDYPRSQRFCPHMLMKDPEDLGFEEK